MRIRNVSFLAVLIAAVLCARSSHALIHGPEDPEEAKKLIEKVTADQEFAIKQNQERALLNKKNDEVMRQRSIDLYTPSAENAKLPGPGVVSAAEAAAVHPVAEGILSPGKLLLGFVFLSLAALFGYIWIQTRKDQLRRQQNKQNAVQGKQAFEKSISVRR